MSEREVPFYERENVSNKENQWDLIIWISVIWTIYPATFYIVDYKKHIKPFVKLPLISKNGRSDLFDSMRNEAVCEP